MKEKSILHGIGLFAFQINSSILEKTTLNENHEISSYKTKEKSEGSLKIKRFLKMGNFIPKYPKQKKIKFVKPVLPNKIKQLWNITADG